MGLKRELYTGYEAHRCKKTYAKDGNVTKSRIIFLWITGWDMLYAGDLWFTWPLVTATLSVGRIGFFEKFNKTALKRKRMPVFKSLDKRGFVCTHRFSYEQ